MIAKSRIKRGSGETLLLLCRQFARFVSCGTAAYTFVTAAQPPEMPDGTSLQSTLSIGVPRTSALRQVAAMREDVTSTENFDVFHTAQFGRSKCGRVSRGLLVIL